MSTRWDITCPSILENTCIIAADVTSDLIWRKILKSMKINMRALVLSVGIVRKISMLQAREIYMKRLVLDSEGIITYHFTHKLLHDIYNMIFLAFHFPLSHLLHKTIILAWVSGRLGVEAWNFLNSLIKIECSYFSGLHPRQRPKPRGWNAEVTNKQFIPDIWVCRSKPGHPKACNSGRESQLNTQRQPRHELHA